jgi:hypothetical protein
LAVTPAFVWEHRGGTRFSSLAQITPADVGNQGVLLCRSAIGHQNVTEGLGLREQVSSADEGRLS